MIITRKIQLRIIESDKSLKDEKYSFIKKLQNDVFKAANEIVKHQFFNSIFKERLDFSEANALKAELNSVKEAIKKSTGDELKALQDKESNLKEKFSEAKKKRGDAFKATFNISEQHSSWQIIADCYKFDISITDALNAEITSKLTKDLKAINRGEKSLTTFKNGLPIPFTKKKMKFIEDSEEIAFDWIGDIRFGLVFGRDRSDNESIVRKVMESAYKACNSKIQYKDGKLFLLLCVDVPIIENKLNEDICVGVDLGIKVPVYVAVNNSLERKSLGSIDSFLNFRKQIQKRRRSLQSDLALGASGGKGRTKKLKALDSFKDFEKNWCTTYNHQITSQVIKFAIDNGAGTIKLEFLKGYPNNDNKFLTRNWSYFQVQSMIEYKAKKNGIKVLYIDPYHTSQECSCCGHYEKGQRINQAVFRCKNESCKAFDKDVNADYNAALNISRSTKEVSDVKDTIYYNIKKQLKEVA